MAVHGPSAKPLWLGGGPLEAQGGVAFLVNVPLFLPHQVYIVKVP
jgi:hypothetical protein